MYIKKTDVDFSLCFIWENQTNSKMLSITYLFTCSLAKTGWIHCITWYDMLFPNEQILVWWLVVRCSLKWSIYQLSLTEINASFLLTNVLWWSTSKIKTMFHLTRIFGYNLAPYIWHGVRETKWFTCWNKEMKMSHTPLSILDINFSLWYGSLI